LKKVIALQITHLIIRNFIQLNNPLTAAEIATKLVIPIAIIQPVLSNLIASHIIVEFKNQDDVDEVYLPTVDINILTIAYVINGLELCGQNHLPDISQEQLFMHAVTNFRELMEASEQNRLLKDIVQ
jgi:membrane protein